MKKLVCFIAVALAVPLAFCSENIWYDITPSVAEPAAVGMADSATEVGVGWTDDSSFAAYLDARFRSILWSEAAKLNTYEAVGFLLFLR